MRILEKLLVLLAVFAIILLFIPAPGGIFLLTLSLLGLSVIYVFFSFTLLNGIRLRDMFKKAAYKGVSTMHIIGAVFTGFALQLACLGILFGILLWPGREVVLFSSFIPCMVVVIISIVKLGGAHRTFYIRIITRVPIAAMICIVLWFIPRKKMVEIRYRGRPALIEAVNNSMDNPDDEELKRKEEEEFSKRR